MRLSIAHELARLTGAWSDRPVSVGVAVLAGFLFCGATSLAPVYTYQEGTLSVVLPEALGDGPITVSWRNLDRFGRPQGKRQRRLLGTVPAERRVDLEVGLAGGHDLTLASKKTKLRIWATRGTWFSVPRENRVSLSRRRTKDEQDQVSTTDITLAGPFSVEVQQVLIHGRLEIGRTLGMNLGAAIRPPRTAALVLVAGARSKRRGVVVTLTEQRPKDEIRYWDYPLNLTEKPRRYVIPLTEFTRRDGRPGRIFRLDAFTIRTTELPEDGDRLFLEHLGLKLRAPRVSGVTATKRGLSIRVDDHLRAKNARLHLRGAKTSTSVRVTRRRMQLRGPQLAEARAVYLCYEEARGAEACDPPDAPITAYPLPVRRAQPLLVDDLAGTTPLNALRRPTQVYTSSIGLDSTLVSRRSPGAIQLLEQKKLRLAYVGYRTPVPKRLPRHLGALEITLRGRADPRLVKVGLRDRRSIEPKQALSAHLTELDDQRWQTVRIPLSVFPNRNRLLDAVTVTLESSRDGGQHLELSRIELVTGAE